MNNLDITPQMALAAARVLRDYCKQFESNCKNALLKNLFVIISAYQKNGIYQKGMM